MLRTFAFPTRPSSSSCLLLLLLHPPLLCTRRVGAWSSSVTPSPSSPSFSLPSPFSSPSLFSVLSPTQGKPELGAHPSPPLPILPPFFLFFSFPLLYPLSRMRRAGAWSLAVAPSPLLYPSPSLLLLSSTSSLMREASLELKVPPLPSSPFSFLPPTCKLPIFPYSSSSTESSLASSLSSPFSLHLSTPPSPPHSHPPSTPHFPSPPSPLPPHPCSPSPLYFSSLSAFPSLFFSLPKK